MLKMKFSYVEVFAVVCVYLGFVNHDKENSTEIVTLEVKNNGFVEYYFTFPSQLECSFLLQFSLCCHIP